MAVVMIPFDRRFLDGSVHPLDLAIRPGMLDLVQPVLNPVFSAVHVEHMRHAASGGAVSVARREGELNAVVGQRRMDLVGNGFNQTDQKGRCGNPSRFFTNCTKANLLVRSMAT